MSSRYIIGVDLGTTNCVLAYFDTENPAAGTRVLAVPQWESPDAVETEEVLPSFLFSVPKAERENRFSDRAGMAPGPEDSWIAGGYARSRMALSPGRVVHSAKSWLCHMAVDRTAGILPWQSEDLPAAEKLSPVDVSSAYLRHFRSVWNRLMAADNPAGEFDLQEIIITVPASFDEAAQQLTLEAAEQAGYPQGTRLVEEPQAAFYCWLGRDSHVRRLLHILESCPDRAVRILVCDVGGGTTDMSLFEAAGDQTSKTGLAMRRIAVSEHLLLGGDNIDLTLGYLLEHKLTTGQSRLTGRQWNQLLAQARDLKERVLIGTCDPDTSFTVTLGGSGSGLFASTLSTAISAEEIRRCVLDGFFPLCKATDRPQKKTVGLKEWGLPYARDSAVTRHLAGFLEGRRVDAVFFNGGTVKPEFLRERIRDLITSWQDGEQPFVLDNDAMSLAVARGAARYGFILRRPESGRRIAGGHAHSLYLESAGKGGKKLKRPNLVCVLPKGMEANEIVSIRDLEFDLLVNQPVELQCYYSNRRDADPPGGVCLWNEDDFHPLPSLRTAIYLPADHPKPANNRLRVFLECSLNELGLLRLYCVEKKGEGRWRLDFNLRRDREPQAAADSLEAPKISKRILVKAETLIRAIYGKKKNPDLADLKPRHLPKRLEGVLGSERQSWDSGTLRALWPCLAEGLKRGKRSVEHEETLFNLAGFLLRPGYGVALDETRMEEVWRLFDMGMAHPTHKRVGVQWHLLWRRVAGGLNAARQERIFEQIIPLIREGREVSSEIVRLAGSLERLSLDKKTELVHIFKESILKSPIKNAPPFGWALGRLIARAPLYAGPETVLPFSVVEEVFSEFENRDWEHFGKLSCTAFFAQAARRTDRRDVDIPEDLRESVLRKMEQSGAREEELRVVRELVPIDDRDRVRQFGESLPGGLILIQPG